MKTIEAQAHGRRGRHEDMMLRGSASPLIACAATSVVVALAACASRTSATPTGAFAVTSADVRDGAPVARAQVFNESGCAGSNVSPALAWTGAPATTRSFAVTVFDPDAPTGRGWWHWSLYDIPANVTALPSGAGDSSAHRLPAGAAQGRNDFGAAAYGGPCPPVGDKPHHYHFTVYALDVPSLGVAPGARADAVKAALDAHTVAKAEIVAVYQRAP